MGRGNDSLRMPLTQNLIYKIASGTQWQEALGAKQWKGAPIDLADGYVHFSTALQVEETARRYFAGQGDLVLVAFDAAVMGEHLRWEPSRGGALFPHLYAPLDTSLALWTKPLPWNGLQHVFPPGWNP
jgi:uncharacterized protein (DUF952 family)